MSNRFLKRLIFGVFYLAIFGGLSYSIYLLGIRGEASCFDGRKNQSESGIDCGGSCLSCELKNLSPISFFGEPEILPINEESAAVFFQIKNPNESYGAKSFQYVLIFYDADGLKIKEVSGSTFIYPGRIKTIVEVPIVIASERVASVDLKVAGVDWSSAAEFGEPSIQSRNVKIEFPQKNQVKVTGLILNNNSFPLSSADIVVAVSDQLGIKVSASKTVVRDLEPFQERAFNVFLPLRGQFIESTATKVFVEAIR